LVLKEKKKNYNRLKTKWMYQKGLWYKSPTGKIIDADELERTLRVQKMVS
jgi:hypothetical protein